MNCNEIKLNLPDYAFGKLTAEDAVLIERHLQNCNSCSGELQDFQQLQSLLLESKKNEIPDRYFINMLPRVHERIERKKRQFLPEWVLRAALPAALCLFAVIFFSTMKESQGIQSQESVQAILQEAKINELSTIRYEYNSEDYSAAMNASDFISGEDRNFIKELLGENNKLPLTDEAVDSLISSFNEEDMSNFFARVEQSSTFNL